MTDNNADSQVDVDDIYETIKVLVEESKQRRNDVNQFSPTMYRVPETLRHVSKNCYTPRIVSIGPFHKEDPHLKRVDVHKITCVVDLLHRLNSPWDQSMKACVEMVLVKIVQIKACYEKEETETYDDLKFAQMMVVDACFILEMIYRSDQNKYDSRSFFDNSLLTLYVKHDLLLLENQIPFFVLVDVFECTIRRFKPRASLSKLVLTFLKDMNPFGRELLLDNDEDNTDHDHILGLVQKRYCPTNAMQSEFSKTLSNNSAEEFSKAISYSVTELTVAGVKFKPNKDPNCELLEMNFKSSRSPCFCWSWGKPTFRMPKLKIEDYTESVLRNIIAYEQSSSAVPNYMTSYAFAMERLLDTKEDIIKVIESKVVINNLGSSEQASDMINNICKEVTVKEFVYINQWRQLDAYYNGYWPKNIARLRRTYFGTPWSFIALVGALVLFGLTVAQTYYTIQPA